MILGVSIGGKLNNFKVFFWRFDFFIFGVGDNGSGWVGSCLWEERWGDVVLLFRVFVYFFFVIRGFVLLVKFRRKIIMVVKI